MSQCRSCGAEIIWAKTEKGKLIPIDAEPVRTPPGLFYLVGDESPLTAVAASRELRPVYRSHFATCPNAAQHRQA